MTDGAARDADEQFVAASKAHAAAVALVKSFGDYVVPYDDPGHPRRWTPERRAALEAALDLERKATAALSKAIARLGPKDDGRAE